MPEVSGTRGAKKLVRRDHRRQWMHVAIVNDEVTHETVLYIEGAPVLRNASNAPGLAALAANMPWIIGAGSWDGPGRRLLRQHRRDPHRGQGARRRSG